MVVTVIMLVVFFAVMIGVGVYCHRQATDVKGFIQGAIMLVGIVAVILNT